MPSFLLVAVLLSATNELRAWEVCCPGLECFSDAPPYQSTLQPKCPENLSLNLKLYSRENQLQGEEFSRTVFPSSFKAGVTSVFIVHGWNHDEEAEWMHDMKDAILKKGDYNVVIVGWKGGSQTPNYFQAAADTRSVGAEIALLARKAIENGVSSREKFWCVGHSLGAQACGHAGNRLKFGRITGLDPAAQNFEDRDFGLKASSADFVDVIHSHGQLYAGNTRVGVMKTVGHVEFYPNGGQVQPGCNATDFKIDPLDIATSTSVINLITKILDTAGPICSHMRAIHFFTESILTPCFVARYSCSDQYALPRSCSRSDVYTQTMGFGSSPSGPRGIFYLTTNAHEPFCQG